MCLKIKVDVWLKSINDHLTTLFSFSDEAFCGFFVFNKTLFPILVTLTALETPDHLPLPDK